MDLNPTSLSWRSSPAYFEKVVRCSRIGVDLRADTLASLGGLDDPRTTLKLTPMECPRILPLFYLSLLVAREGGICIVTKRKN
jgi:hypothetical protein